MCLSKLRIGVHSATLGTDSFHFRAHQQRWIKPQLGTMPFVCILGLDPLTEALLPSIVAGEQASLSAVLQTAGKLGGQN